MLETLILPGVVAQMGWGMSQCFIRLAGLVGSLLHLSILIAPEFHCVTCAQLGAEDTWDKAERTPNGLLLYVLCYQLEALIPMHPAWIIQ